MTIIDRASWINASAEEACAPTFSAAGILLLGAMLCVPGRLRRKLFPPKPPKPRYSAAFVPYDLGHMLPMLRPVYTPIRNTIPRVPGHGIPLDFKPLHIVPGPESE